MDKHAFNDKLIAFLDVSPTPFHASANMAEALREAGFIELDERHDWALEAGKGYFCLRNGSSVVAFRVGKSDVAESGWHMVGAHTDSPCLKVKPNPGSASQRLFSVGCGSIRWGAAQSLV